LTLLRFGDFVPVLKTKKWYFSDLVPVLKVNSEYLNKNYYRFQPLVPVLSPKGTAFSTAVTGTKRRPQEIEEKNSKKVYFEYLHRSNYLIYGPKKFLENFLAAFGT
jgi:hypothetical protein